jgi:hypothetical protein
MRKMKVDALDIILFGALDRCGGYPSALDRVSHPGLIEPDR